MPGSQTYSARSIELADGVMLTVAILWASNNVITKAALDRGLEPLIYIVLRFALIAALLFPYLWMRQVSLRVRRTDIPRFVVSGLCGFALYNMLYVVGLSHTSAFSAAIIVSLAPIFILTISSVLGIERVRRLQWAGVALSLLGVSVFISEKLLAGEPAIGDLVNLIAALSFAVYGLTTRPLVIRYGSETTIAWAVLVGLVAVIPFTAGSVRDEDWGALTGFEWLSIAWVAIISVMLGYPTHRRRAVGAVSFPYTGLYRNLFGHLSRGPSWGATTDRRRHCARRCCDRPDLRATCRSDRGDQTGRGNGHGARARAATARRSRSIA